MSRASRERWSSSCREIRRASRLDRAWLGLFEAQTSARLYEVAVRSDRVRLGLVYLVALSMSAGCSAIVSPDVSRLGGDPGGPDGGRDSGIVLRDGSAVDARDGPDGGGVDGGPPSCEAQPPVCEGNVLVQCVGGTLRRTDCSATGGVCAMSSGAAACSGGGCTPFAVSCDGDELVTCSAEGTESRMTCPTGCDPAARACRGAMVCPGVEALAPGVVRFDLCAERDARTFVPAEGCLVDLRANTGDRVYRLDIEHASNIQLDLRDDDDAAIDTVLYIRRDCDDAASQFACNDDIPCAMSDVTGACIDGFQVRHSRLTLHLEPGTYYVVADAYSYSTSGLTFGCGNVSLTYTVR